jgi:competence protein ComFC
MRAAWGAFVHLIYPALCIHCSQNTVHYRRLICEECKALFTLIDPLERCPRCFIALPENGSLSCERCGEQRNPFKGLAAAFDHIGPAASFISALKYGGRFKLAKDAAAFMLVQFSRLHWPMPDAIVPVPQSFSRWMMRGYNQSHLIAQEFGKMIERPVYDLLKKKSGDFSQTGLNRQQRSQLSSDSFRWKKPKNVSDKTLLVIDDVMTTSATLRHCGAVLQEGFPKCLYGLTFCLS